MTDIELRQDEQLPVATKIRYQDLGEGIHALVKAAIIFAEVANGEFRAVGLDSYENALVIVDHYTYSVHHGNRFKACYLRPHGSELANDATYNLLVATGSQCPHAKVRVGVGGNCDLLIFEGVTVSANGNLLPAYGKNRVDSGTALTEVYDSPTITNDGTSIFQWFAAAGEKGFAGGGSWGETEWLLKLNTLYVVRIVNRSGGPIQFAMSVGWTEH